MSQENEQITSIPVCLIDPGPNDRLHFDENALRDLASSIDQHGLAQPITVRPLGERYEIVAGERRFRAVRLLGRETIPCLVRALDDEQAASIMLAENTSRADLNPIEEAEAYQRRIRQFGWTSSRVAEIAGVSEQRVRDRITLLDLVPELQQLIRFGHFPLGHARLMSGLDNNRQRIALRIYNESQHMPLSRFKGVVNELLEAQSQDSLFDLEAFMISQAQLEASEPGVIKGRKARTGAPTRKDLPPVRYRITDGIAHILDRYIHDLLETGFGEEAAAVGNVYNTLVAHNWTAIPTGAILPKVSPAEETAGQAPEQRID